MVEPFGISALIVTTLQFVVQVKTYLHEKKKRKRQEQEQQHMSLPPSSPPITYCICYPIYQAYPNYNVHYHNYMHPSPPNYNHHTLPLQPPTLYYPNHHITNSCSDPRPGGAGELPSPSTRCHASLISSASSSPSYDWLGLLGGRMELLHHQQAPHNTHEMLGMRTGACAYNDRISSYRHWKSLQEESWSQGLQKTIAVVDWTRGNIDMFMEIRGAYFRNYRISGCDVAAFACLWKEREVFSGEIREEKLERCNKEIKMVENVRGVRSTNSWMRLGIYEESEDMEEVLREEGLFIQIVRGAVFGLVCCLYEDPANLNVDMEAVVAAQYVTQYNGHLDIVRVNSHHDHHPSQYHGHLKRRRFCLFSVFSFGDHSCWAAQDILLG